LAPELDELPRCRIGDDVGPFLALVDPCGIAGDVEGRRPAIEADASVCGRSHSAGIMTLGGHAGIAARSAAPALDKNEVGDLALARIIGTEKIAWPDFHALYPACRDAAEISVE